MWGTYSQACMQNLHVSLWLYPERSEPSGIRSTNLKLESTSCIKLIGILSFRILLKLQITQTLRFLHWWWWQADGSRAQKDQALLSELILSHLHFMSLNCVCFPPPHRPCDFVPVTVRPCTLEEAVIDWGGPSVCIPSIVFEKLENMISQLGSGCPSDIGRDRTRQGKFEEK